MADTDELRVGRDPDADPPTDEPVVIDGDDAGEGRDSVGPDELRAARSARFALWAFAALVVGTFFTLLLTVGRSRWFFLDEWMFLSDRQLSVHDLLRPHNEHWSTLPIIYYRVVWHLFGLRSYVPYVAASIGAHLAVACLLRVIMRRHGVGPWIATLTAGLFVLFGTGEENILWAFQIGFVGGLAFGLLQLVLADRDGPLDRRDWLGLLAAAALLCSGIGAVMVVVVALTMLLRRGWRIAAFHSVPLAAMYGIWYIRERPEVAIPTPPGQHITVGDVLGWLRVGEWSVLSGFGQFAVVGALLGIVMVVGLVIAWVPLGITGFRRTAAAPAMLLVGGVLIQLLAVSGRWSFGADYASHSRYVHLVAATTVPALGVAVDALIHRWRYLAPVLAVLLLVGVPGNIVAFNSESSTLDPSFMFEQAVVFGTAAMPFAPDAQRQTHVMTDAGFGPDNVTIGWILDAKRAGKLPAQVPVNPIAVNGFKVRLGVRQLPTISTGGSCRDVRGSLDIAPNKGQQFGIQTPVSIVTIAFGNQTSLPVNFDSEKGHDLLVGLPGLSLRLLPQAPATSFTVCNI